MKILIASVLFYVLYKQLFLIHDFDVLKAEFFKSKKNSSILYLWLAFVFMFLNWFLEAKRWQLLVKSYHDINIYEALKAIVMGVTLGIISPQRVGEYAGRLMSVPADKNWLSIKSNFYTSISLNIIIVIFGLLGLLYYLQIVSDLDYSISLIVFAALLSLSLLFILYTKLPWLEEKLNFSSFFEWSKTWGKFKEYNFGRNLLLKVLVYSFARYFVFVFQYFLILKYFGIHLELDFIFSSVAVIYLIQSIIPLPGMISLLARGEIAILIFTPFHVNEFSIFASTFSLWIINLLLPALIGMIVLWKTKITESLGLKNYE